MRTCLYPAAVVFCESGEAADVGDVGGVCVYCVWVYRDGDQFDFVCGEDDEGGGDWCGLFIELHNIEPEEIALTPLGLAGTIPATIKRQPDMVTLSMI